MGREIRRVPKDWEHPKDKDGYIPMLDETFEDAAREWLDNCIAWDNGTHEDCEKYKDEYSFWWEWDGETPEREWYRPAFTSEPTHYQIYQNVSEGTPVSPVFASLNEMVEWLVSEGYSRAAAEGFAESGYVPSMVFSPATGVVMGIHTADKTIFEAPQPTEGGEGE